MARTHRRLRDESGVTLVELLVVVVILGFVGAIVTQAMITSIEATRKGQDRVQALADLQKGLERVGRELRAADPLILDNSLDFDERVSAQVRRGAEVHIYEYYLVGTGVDQELREDIRRWSSVGSFQAGDPPAVTQSGLFIANVANDITGTDLFRYLDQTGTEISCADLDTTTSTGRDTCVSRHATAAQVVMSLQKILGEQDPLTLTTTINVRNTRYQP